MFDDLFTAVSVALICASAGLLSLAVLPRVVLLALLILIRSVADVGGSSISGSLLPSAAISAAVAVGAIFAVAIPTDSRTSSRFRFAAAVLITAFTLWTCLAVYNFGVELVFVLEIVRLLSIVAILLLAYRVGVDATANFPLCINAVVGIPAVLLILGYAANWLPSLNPAGRAVGTFNHANAAGAYFAVGVIACLWAFAQAQRRSSLFVAFLALTALLLTQSLGALGATAAGAVVLFSLNAKLSVERRFALIFLGVGLIVALFFSIGASARLAEFQGVDYFDAESDNSLDWRLLNWQVLLQIWWERAPLEGLGLGSTVYRYEAINPMGQLPHSIPVQLLVETGLIGVSIAAVLTVLTFGAIRRRYKVDPQSAAALAAVITTVMVHGLAANWLIYGASQYLAVFAIGLMLGRSGSDSSKGVGRQNKFLVQVGAGR